MTYLFALQAGVGEQQSLWSALWQYFKETLWNPPDEYYEHINVGSNSFLSVRLIILGLCIGLSLAAFAAVFNKRVLGELVRRVLKAQALSPDDAKTLDELGYGDSYFAHLAVRRSTTVRRVVKCREEQAFIAEQNELRERHNERRKSDKSLRAFKESSYKINTFTDRFYIPEELRYTAEFKFEKKGSTWLGAIIFTVIMAVLFVVALLYLPQILGMINSIVGTFKGIAESNSNVL